MGSVATSQAAHPAYESLGSLLELELAHSAVQVAKLVLVLVSRLLATGCNKFQVDCKGNQNKARTVGKHLLASSLFTDADTL